MESTITWTQNCATPIPLEQLMNSGILKLPTTSVCDLNEVYFIYIFLEVSDVGIAFVTL